MDGVALTQAGIVLGSAGCLVMTAAAGVPPTTVVNRDQSPEADSARGWFRLAAWIGAPRRGLGGIA
jgi:hypothetical protein